MAQKVTVITLYDDSLVEHYVAVVMGEVSPQEREALAEKYDASLTESEDGLSLSFKETTIYEGASKVDGFVSITD